MALLIGSPDFASVVRRAVMSAISAVFGGGLFRLCLGRWPDAGERVLFKAGLCDGGTPMPALLRAMHAVPASRLQISRLLLFGLMRDGRLSPPPLEFGTMPIAPQVGNPLSFWEGPKVSFLHLEKTAGTALANALTERFHPLQIDPDPHRTMPPHLRSAFPTPALGAIRDRKLVWGHYDLPSLLRLGSDRVIVTMLREPTARILSLYRYWRSVEPALLEPFGNDGVKLAHRFDLVGFLRHEDPFLRDSIDNLYVRRLTGFYSSGSADRLAADPAGSLELARRALGRLAFVGVIERMEESLAGLSASLGAPLLELQADNISEANASARPGLFRPVEQATITPEIAIELDRLTSLDRVIYAECLARLDGRMEKRAA